MGRPSGSESSIPSNDAAEESQDGDVANPASKSVSPPKGFVIPREFTNYDRNAHTWRNGSAREIYERSAKVPSDIGSED